MNKDVENKNCILEVKNLSVSFPVFGGVLKRKVGSVDAVKDVSLKLYKGETLGIVGESGSGKTTIGNTILNVLRLTAPDVKVDGEIFLNLGSDVINLLSLSRKGIKNYRKYIQMIFQDPYSSLNPRMLVKDIVREPLDINSEMSISEKNDKIEWLFNKVGLTMEQSNRYPHEFSGGQRQRIGIARSLATDPDIIIADEPVSALDVSIQAQIINLMMDLQEEFNLSIIFIAHDLSVVKHICSRIAVIHQGSLIEIGSTDNIFKNPEQNYTKQLLRSIPIPNPDGREERKKNRLNSVSNSKIS
tara:strand:- start:62245 stop:63147 length:903 start_codon:yes stop_codon:yes gene_type:complete